MTSTAVAVSAPRRPNQATPHQTRVGNQNMIGTSASQMKDNHSERIAGLLEADGMTRTADLDQADVVFVNTCTIRENADNRLYGTLGHLKQLKDARPDSLLVVGGCAAQKDRDIVRERAPWVDVV